MALPVASGKTNATVTRDDHPNHHNALADAINDDLLRAALAPASPARALDTPFTPHATRPMFVAYIVELSATASTVSAQFASVELQVEAVTRSEAELQFAPAPVAVLGTRLTSRHTLSALIPAGDEVELVSATGGGTATLVSSTETAL